MLRRLMSGIVVAAALASLGGCATRHYTSYQDFEVATKPGGARCELQQGDYRLSFKTPATLRLQKSADKIAINCRQGEFMVGSATVEPSRLPMAQMDVLQGVPGRAFYIYDASVLIRLTEEPAMVDAAPTENVQIKSESVPGSKSVVLPPMLPRKKGSLETFMESAPAKKTPSSTMKSVKPAPVKAPVPVKPVSSGAASKPAAVTPKATMSPIPD